MPSKTNYKDFSAKVKVKYPEYGNMDDLSLAKMWVEQNPQYGEFVVFDEPTPQKKSPVGTTPGQPVGSQFVSSGDPIADRAQTQSAIKGYAKNKDKSEEIGFWENLGLNFANGSNRLFNDAFQTAYEGSLAMQGVPAAGIQEISKYKSRPLKEDFRTKTRQDMGLLEESTAAFANSLPIMLSSMAMGGAANIATKAGKVAGALPSFISGFQESGREADEIGIKDPLDRLAFQTAGGGIEAVSEFILPDASLIRPLRQRALKDLVRIGSKGLSKADVGRYVAEFTEKVAKEIGEEYAVEVGEALRGVSFAVAGYDSAMPEMKSARDYAVMTLSAAIGAGTVGGVGTLANAAYAKSSAIKKASENPEEASQAVADLIDAGKLTEEQGNEFLTKVNMLSRTSSRMPKNIDPEVAVNSSELLNQKMDIEEQIKDLEEEKKGIDDSFVPEIDTQIASLTEQLNALTQQISSIRPTEQEDATIELDIPDAVDLSTEDQSVLDIMSSRFEEPYLNAINQRINNAEEISLSEIENIAGDMINELTVVSESQDLTDNQKQQLSQLVENQIDNLLNYEFATTTTTEQAGQKTKAAGIISTPREGRPLPESKVSRERFEGAGVRIGGRGAGRITVKPIAGFGGRSVYGISFGNRRGVTPVEDLEFDNLEFVAPVILEDGSFNARMRDSKTGLELTITDPELSIDLAIAESLRQAGKTTFPQPAFLEAFNEVTKGTPTQTTTFPNIGRTGTAPEAAGVQPQTEQDVRQETNVTQERGDEGEASSRLPQEEGRQEGQVTPAVEGEAQASPTANVRSTTMALEGKTGGILQPPTAEQKLDDVKNKRISTFIYSNESDVPTELRDKITTRSVINDRTEIRVSLPTSEAEYLLNKDDPKAISEAYHAAKSKTDGARTDREKKLVQAIDDLLTPKNVVQTDVKTTESQSSPAAKKKKTAQERADENKAKLEKLKDALKSLKAKPGGRTNIDLTFGVVPITKAVWNTAIDTAILAIDAGQTIAQAVKAASDYISSQIQGDWGKNRVSQYLEDLLDVTQERIKSRVSLEPLPEALEIIDGFYSVVERKVLDTLQEKQSATKWINALGKGDEVTYTGLGGWLASKKPDEQVSKREILDWMKDNRIEVRVRAMGNESENYSDKLRVLEQRQREALQNEDYGAADFYQRKIDQLNEAKSNEETPAKFSQYQLEGEKENYQEVLVMLPQKTEKANYEVVKRGDLYYPTDKIRNIPTSPYPTFEQAKSEADRLNKIATERTSKNTFRSTHFSDPNILVHLRMNTRVDADGRNKVLFLEEVQSDWGQKGKKLGFKKDENAYKKADEAYGRYLDRMKAKYGTYNFEEYYTEEERYEEYALLADRDAEETGRVPSAPFVTDTNAWTKLGLKIALKEAVKQDADKLAWTTGEQQNDRYDLKKDLNYLDYWKNNNGTYGVTLDFKKPQEFTKPSELTEKELNDYFGKEIAAKIISDTSSPTEDNPKRLEGDDLAVGGKGMKGFYGSPTEGILGIVGNVAKSLVKQEVGTVEINKGTDDLTKEDALRLLDKGEKVYTYNRGTIFRLYNKDDINEATNYFSKKGEAKSIQYSIDITPEVKAQVEAGIPLFDESPTPKTERVARLRSEMTSAVEKAQEKPTTQPDVLKDVESTAKALEGVDISDLSKELGIEANWDMEGEGDFLSGKDPSLAYTQKQLPDWNRASQRGEVNPNSKLTYDIVRGKFGGIDNKEVVEAKDENGVVVAVVKLDSKGGIEHIAIAPEFRGKGVSNKLIEKLKETNPNLDLSKTKLRSKGFEKAFAKNIISEAYHKAKKDGSNPELVKAVEDLLVGEQQQEKAEKPIAESFANDLDAEYSKMKDSFFGGMDPNKNRLFFTDATNDFQYRGDSRADIVLMLDGANFWLTEGPNGYVTIEDFQVSEDKLGTGKGKFALSKLIEYADRNGITLIGEPLAQAERERGRVQKGLSQKQLIEFYKKNGFEKISKDSLSKNRTAEANYLERKPKDSVEKTETEKPIAESRREFREKARKYFDGLKKLGFAFDAERNAKEDIAFLKALKDYIKLEIDNGMVTFKGFIEKASAIMPEFSNAELKAKAKELWGQEVVKEYPKLMAKYSEVKQQQLEGEIKEIKKDLVRRIVNMTSPKAVNVKGQIKTEKRKLSQEAAGQLATIRDAFDVKSMLAMDPKDLLELYNLTNQIYKEGKSDIGALNDELNKQAKSQGDAMLEAITSEGKRLQKLKDEATARKKLSLNAGVVIAMNEDERVLLKTEKELDALEGKGYTFMFLNTKGDKYSDRNFLMRFFSGRFRSAREIARDLRTALEFIKSPAKSSQDFINSLVEKMNKASVIKARKTDSWSSILKEARNRYFGSDLNFSYTNWMNGVPKVDGNVLEIEDGTGERIQGMTNAKIVTLYRQIMDPRNLVKPKGNENGPRKINLTDKSIQDIIDYMNLPQNEAGKGFALSLNKFFAQVAKDVSQVLESNGYNADKLKEARYDKDKVNDEFIVKIMDQFVSMRPDGFIPYTPVQATESPDMAQGVEISEDDLLNSTDLQKNFSVISNNMITKRPGGQIVPTDIRQTLNAYTAGMANMSAKLPLLRETQAVFSKRNLTAMNNAFAPQFTENLKANYISYMTDRVVPTSSSKTSAAIKSWLMQSTAIPMFLNFKSSVLQLLAAPNFLASYDFSRYIDSFKELSKNPRLMGVTILEIIDLPTVKQRFGGRFSPDSRAISDDTSTYGNLSFKIPFTDLKISSKELLSKGYIFSSFGDVLSIAIGGAPVYYDIKKTNKAKYLSEGMSEKDAESKAKEDAEEKLYEIIQETQQSSDAMYLSQFQKQSITRLFSSFATATMQYYRKARRASLRMKNKEGNQRQNAYEILHYTVINAAVFQLFSSMLIDAISGPGEDELEEMNRQERMDMVRYMEDVMATVAQGTGAMGVALQALILGLKESEKSGKPEKIVESTLRTMPAVRMKYEAAVNAIREWKRGDYVKSFAKGGELVNIPADRIRALGLQVSDALTENLEFQERLYRLLGFRTESWMREKKQGEIWDGIQSRIDNSTVSERQRAIGQTMEDYRSLFKDYGKRYAEARTEADRKRIDSIAVKELGNVYNHRKGGEEFSDELRKIASRSIEFYSLPKDLQELKDKNSDKKIETIVNEYIRLEKKDPKKADEYWSLLVANEIVSKNEIKKIAEEYDTEKGHR
jgi:GNAT superfamily N-acetyltransferase